MTLVLMAVLAAGCESRVRLRVKTLVADGGTTTSTTSRPPGRR